MAQNDEKRSKIEVHDDKLPRASEGVIIAECTKNHTNAHHFSKGEA